MHPYTQELINKNHKSQRETYYCFYQVRNYQAEQEGIFLALLNHEYTITLKVPQKKSVVSLNYFRIVSFVNENEKIFFEDELKVKLKMMYDEDLSKGIKENTAVRRMEINKIAESIHYLIEMLKKRKIEMKMSVMGKRNSRSSVIEMDFDGIIFDKNEIQKKGNLIIQNILDRMKNLQRKDTLVIEKNDLELMCLLFS